MSRPEQEDPGQVEDVEVLDEPARDLEAWARWREDQSLGNPSQVSGFKGRVIATLKRLTNPLLRRLWKRQIGFNLSVIDHLETAEQSRFDLLRDLREIRSDLLRDVQNNHRRIAHLEEFKREGYADVMRHSDALYAVVDQKLDRYRRKSQELWGELGGLLAQVESPDRDGLAANLEQRWSESAHRRLEDPLDEPEQVAGSGVSSYLPYLPATGLVLDVGCGRGRALLELQDAGYEVRGVDSDAEKVAECQRQGLNVVQADLLQDLRQSDEESLGAVLSRYVIEDLDASRIDLLVRLAWRALEPGGTLILETPNPLSLVVAARNFWRDPGHLRPVHPATLAQLLRLTGFDSVEHIDIHPFEAGERLPDLSLDELPSDQRMLADRLSRIRDDLDDLLFGYQAYAVVGKKPV